MYTIEDTSPKPGRRRRTHSAEFKSQAVASCQQPGVSVAAVALSCGVNANLLRRWILTAQTSASTELRGAKRAEFIPLPFAQSASTGATTQDIRVEIRRGATLVNISWPVHAGADCAAWLRDLLR